MRNLDANKPKEKSAKNGDETRWERVFNRIVNDTNKIENFEYVELVIFKTLLKLQIPFSLKRINSYSEYEFNVQAVDEFLEYNSEKFNYAFDLMFDEPSIDEALKKTLKKY